MNRHLRNAYHQHEQYLLHLRTPPRRRVLPHPLDHGRSAAESLTVEFLCGEGASAKAPSAAGSYGTYSFDGPTSTFKGLSLQYGDIVIIIEEGYRDGDRMTLTWHYADPQEADLEEARVAEAFTTSMYRLSEYP